MRDWKEIGRKLLFPPVWLMWILVVVTTIVLVTIFTQGWEVSVVAYAFYPLAAYTLTIFCLWCWRRFPGLYRILKEKAHENQYTDKYLTDVAFKTKVGLYRSLIINLIYVALNAVSGVLYQSYWFGIFALYYGIIAVMRFLLVRYVKRHPIGNHRLGELKRARICAYILLTVNLVLSGVVMMMVSFGRGFQYEGMLIYVIATYTFYITTTAIIDMVKYRKYKSPIMSITKVIKMTSALFSMLFLETAMFAQFGAETSLESKDIMIMITGAGISITVVAMAIYMIVQTSREIKEYRGKKMEYECLRQRLYK